MFTAIIAGLLISLLGGSRVQIGGPAGAFIVIVYGIVERYGLANLIIATAMSGVMLFAIGFFKLGTLIRFIPIAVIIGFTNGIAVLIAVSQVKDFLGLERHQHARQFFWHVPRPERRPAHYQPLRGRVGTGLSGAAGVLAVWPVPPAPLPALDRTTGHRCLALWWYWCWPPWWCLCLTCRWRPLAAGLAAFPADCPALVWPDFSWESARFLLIPALTLALLGRHRVLALRPRGRQPD